MMASSSTTALLKKGKRGAAKYVHQSCLHASSPHHLQELLDLILNPCKTINEWEAIDWLKWLMAGGSTPDEFASLVRRYDNASTCGLVWTANFVAYRCRTCGISPCMSLCAECFQMSNHFGHDFNMFRSQAGGACDCGDTSVMKETGFCTRHGPRAQMNKPNAPNHLMCVAEAIMPRIIYRLIQHLRENSNLNNENDEAHTTAIKDADLFLTMLRDLNALGAAMRRVMTTTLINPQVYRNLNEYKTRDEELNRYVEESYRIYSDAILSFPNPDPPEEYKDCPALQKYLVHRTFLDELVFWTVKFEFPQKIVCLLLNMLPDPEYKEALTQAFVLHYSRIAMMLEKCRDPDTLSNRVVHVSVQLFSNEALALRMAQEYNLLHVMVISLRNMMKKIVMECALHDQRKNFHYSVDCGLPVMKEHCYWPLVSDLNNVLSHQPIALKFMTDEHLPEMWFSFILMFQGMNVNHRELINHIEFEPTSYYAAFSAELEASAYPMWALVSHLSNAETAHLTKRVITSCLVTIQDWLDAINYDHPNVPDIMQISFHFPLHRYLAVLICQAVRNQGLTLAELLPPPDLLHLIMMHPLRVQAGFYEILAQIWGRNGLQMRGQAMTYIQCNFCNSMVDADLFLLQIIATRLPSEVFLAATLDKFRIVDWLSMSPFASSPQLFLNATGQSPMVEGFLTFLATLLGSRTNIGENETELSKLEIVTLLCMFDKTHSQILELLPERCGTAQTRDFEATLAGIAEYRAPNLEASGNMQQGIYLPKPHVWRDLFDPIHALLRAVHRKDYQSAIDRFTIYAQGTGKVPFGVTPWPPYRIPTPVHSAFEDPCKLLGSRLFHATAFVILYKSVFNQNVTDNSVALLIHLLDLAVIYADPHPNTQVTAARQFERPHQYKDKDLLSWYQSDWLSNNLRTIITRVIMNPEPTIVFDSSDNEGEWDRDMEVLDTSQQLDNSVLELEILETTPLSPQTDLVSMTPPGIEWNPNSVGSLTTALPAPVVLPAVMAGTEIVPHAGPSTSEVSTVSTTSAAECALVPASPSINPSSSAETSGAVVKKSRRIRRRVRVKQQPTEENPSIGIDSSSSDTSPQAPSDSHMDVNESIISLLLRFHSSLTGLPDSFDPKDNSRNLEDCVGDGTWFVARLLHRIYRLDDPCREAIMETKARLWPKDPKPVRRSSPVKEEYRERRADVFGDREERKRRAKERQKQVMEEIANQQKLFLERALNDEEVIDIGMEWREINSGGAPRTKGIPNESFPIITIPPPVYRCVICTQTTPSLEENPIELIVLVQPTSVLGFRRKLDELPRLPVDESERAEYLRRDDTQASEFERRFEELGRHFNNESVMMSVSQAWQSGVHLLTCGHYIHYDCLKSYQQSLRTANRQQNLSIEGGEFMCPLCRQLANSVLPISPQLGECAAALVRSRGMIDSATAENVKEADRQTISREIADLLKENPPPPSTATGLDVAMAKAMDDMRVASQIKFKQRSQYPPPSWQSMFLFVSSIARTNLEVEILRTGALDMATHAAPPKRSCIVPLLHVLARHARALAQWPAWDTWARLSGISFSTTNMPSSSVLIQNATISADPGPSNHYAVVPMLPEAPVLPEVPLLLRDPTALLIHFVLLLPLHVDQVYFTSVVRTLYNLMYVQAAVQLTYSFSNSERSQWSTVTPTDKLQSLDEVLSLVIRSLEASQLYADENQASCSTLKQGQEPMATNMDINLLKNEIYKLCLTFLRVAALLRHHLYERPLHEEASSVGPPPAPPAPGEDVPREFQRLISYLDLESTPVSLAPQIAVGWCLELGSLSAASASATRPLLAEAHIMWHPPRLLKLPRIYDTIFQFYHRRTCSHCHLNPRESTVCLICGTNLCLRDSCCKQNSICEGVQHSIDCGGGTAIFLVVTSSYVVVVKGKRACIWGTLYLDHHGEEDRELKRGKPLHLSMERYNLLEEQWLSHRFDHTSKKNWVWHRDGL